MASLFWLWYCLSVPEWIYVWALSEVGDWWYEYSLIYFIRMANVSYVLLCTDTSVAPLEVKEVKEPLDPRLSYAVSQSVDPRTHGKGGKTFINPYNVQVCDLTHFI